MEKIGLKPNHQLMNPEFEGKHKKYIYSTIIFPQIKMFKVILESNTYLIFSQVTNCHWIQSLFTKEILEIANSVYGMYHFQYN